MRDDTFIIVVFLTFPVWFICLLGLGICLVRYLRDHKGETAMIGKLLATILWVNFFILSWLILLRVVEPSLTSNGFDFIFLILAGLISASVAQTEAKKMGWLENIKKKEGTPEVKLILNGVSVAVNHNGRPLVMLAPEKECEPFWVLTRKTVQVIDALSTLPDLEKKFDKVKSMGYTPHTIYIKKGPKGGLKAIVFCIPHPFWKRPPEGKTITVLYRWSGGKWR